MLKSIFWICVLIAGGGAILAMVSNAPHSTSTSELHAKGYCDNPKPSFTVVPGEAPLKRTPPAKLFADFDAMAEEFHRTGVKNYPLKRTSDMVRQLLAFHGEPQCPEAEKRLDLARTIDRAALVVEMDRLEAARIANDSAGRSYFAKEMEKKFLSGGQDFDIQALGDKATTLRIKWVLIGRPFVYKVTNEGDFLQNIKKRGFKSVIFTDGYNSTWTYDLSKQ